MRKELIVELALADSLNAGFPLHTLLYMWIFVLLFEFAGFQFILILAVESLKLLFLFNNATVGLFGVISAIESSVLMHADLSQWSETVLGTLHILHQNVINVLVWTLPIARVLLLHKLLLQHEHFRSTLLKDNLKLLLLFRRKELVVLQQFKQLLIA